MSLLALIGVGLYFWLHRFGPQVEKAEDSMVPAVSSEATPSPSGSPKAAPSSAVAQTPKPLPIVESTQTDQLPDSEESRAFEGGRLSGDPYAQYPVVSFEQTPTNAKGEFTRSKVVQTRKKYPHLLVIEKFIQDPRTGKEKLIQRQAMVADHLVVKLNDRYSEADLAQYAQSQDAEILEKISALNYLIKFQATDVSSLQKMIAQFKRSPIVSDPEPNYVVRN
jgi:hypothetical protein